MATVIRIVLSLFASFPDRDTFVANLNRWADANKDHLSFKVEDGTATMAFPFPVPGAPAVAAPVAPVASIVPVIPSVPGVTWTQGATKPYTNRKGVQGGNIPTITADGITYYATGKPTREGDKVFRTIIGPNDYRVAEGGDRYRNGATYVNAMDHIAFRTWKASNTLPGVVPIPAQAEPGSIPGVITPGIPVDLPTGRKGRGRKA